MPGSARSYVDIWTGICCCHEEEDPPCIPMAGTIMSGSLNSSSGNEGQGRVTDITIGYCGHGGILVSGSSTCSSNSLGKGRIGSIVTGCNIGTIVSGFSSHEIGG